MTDSSAPKASTSRRMGDITHPTCPSSPDVPQSAETRHDAMDPARAAALWVALDLRGTTPGTNAPLPPFFHHLHFWEARAPQDLGHDGHPRVGSGTIPDMGLPRRMWAGGRLRFHAPLMTAVPATRTTRLVDAVHKAGRSGPLALVTLEHKFHQQGRVCVTERQDLVYRAAEGATTIPSPPPPDPPKTPDDASDTRAVTFDPTVLFRYSALTFNGHRIHYDVDYARQVEGYGGLVVHGPLLAQHLILWATDILGPLAAFDFRLTAPLICGEPATLCRSDTRFWVEGPHRRQCIIATAHPA